MHVYPHPSLHCRITDKFHSGGKRTHWASPKHLGAEGSHCPVLTYMVLCPDLNSLTRLGARTAFYSATAPTQSKAINKSWLTEGLTDCRNSRSLEISGLLHCTTPKNTIQIIFHGCASLHLVKFRLFFFSPERNLRNSLLEQNYSFPCPLSGSNYMSKFSQLSEESMFIRGCVWLCECVLVCMCACVCVSVHVCVCRAALLGGTVWPFWSSLQEVTAYISSGIYY